MIINAGLGRRQGAGIRRLTLPAWQVDLADAGSGRACPSTGPGPATMTLREEERMRRLAGPAPARSPRTEIQLGPDGTARVRCDHAPPVLLVRACTETAHPLVGEDRAAGVTVPEGAFLFACSPSLLDAMEPMEVIAAPRLLWLSDDPSLLLQRWVSAAADHGPGGAAVVARRVAAASTAGEDIPESTPAGRHPEEELITLPLSSPSWA